MPVNMSHCRFQNTLQALHECDDALTEINGDLSELSDDEKRAAQSLLKLCAGLADWFGEVKS